MLIFLRSSGLVALLSLAQGDAPQFETGGGLLWMLLQTFFVLVFVCALAFVVIRLLPRQAGLGATGSMLRIVDRVPLDQRRSLYVVKVAGRWLLVGSSEGGVQLISELDPEIAEQEAERAARERPTLGGVGAKARTVFADRLADLMKKKR
jgi:flagellar protein FliO/FliZ